MEEDENYMLQALEIAQKGRWRVMPNPLVGRVIVKEGEIIAKGWHDHIGGLHAEQMAIADAEDKGISLQGATAYITLEPCNHFGRTPPCTEALLWAGIKKVVIGALDPNPTVRGGGLEMLQKEDFKVKNGVLEELCEEQMESFMHWCRNRRPLVTLKAATDINERIDGAKDKPAKRFSSDESLKLVHELRADSMAILVGVNTVMRDDPELTVRGPELGPREAPIRVVVDPNNRMIKKGKEKLKEFKNLNWVIAPAEKLPINTNSFDFYTISFGLRNTKNLDKALKEAYRVLKPGGRYLCLEFSKIQNSGLNFIYRNYSKLIPSIGKFIVGEKKPYEYLIKSIENFVNQEQLIDLMKKNGFEKCSYRNLSGGIVSIHSGWKI